MRLGWRTVDGMQIRFGESAGSQGNADPVVLSGPWPESILAFEGIWPHLAGKADLLAIDLPGFGRSERRTELLNPQAMGEFIVSVLDNWGIERAHLVCPDVGTAASLFAAAAHPRRIRSLVVGTGATAYPLGVAGLLKDVIDAPDTSGLLALEAERIVANVMAALGDAAPDEEVASDYVESNRAGRFAEAARYVRSYPEQLPILAGLLPGILTPVQIIAGRADPIVPLANAEYLAARLTNSRLEVLDAGHFVWEEAPERYAALVADWVAGGYLAEAGGQPEGIAATQKPDMEKEVS